jgi:hypothetical protein
LNVKPRIVPKWNQADKGKTRSLKACHRRIVLSC